MEDHNSPKIVGTHNRLTGRKTIRSHIRCRNHSLHTRRSRNRNPRIQTHNRSFRIHTNRNHHSRSLLRSQVGRNRRHRRRFVPQQPVSDQPIRRLRQGLRRMKIDSDSWQDFLENCVCEASRISVVTFSPSFLLFASFLFRVAHFCAVVHRKSAQSSDASYYSISIYTARPENNELDIRSWVRGVPFCFEGTICREIYQLAERCWGRESVAGHATSLRCLGIGNSTFAEFAASR